MDSRRPTSVPTKTITRITSRQHTADRTVHVPRPSDNHTLNFIVCMISEHNRTVHCNRHTRVVIDDVTLTLPVVLNHLLTTNKTKTAR